MKQIPRCGAVHPTELLPIITATNNIDIGNYYEFVSGKKKLLDALLSRPLTCTVPIDRHRDYHAAVGMFFRLVTWKDTKHEAQKSITARTRSHRIL